MHSPRYEIKLSDLNEKQGIVLLWLAEGKTQREIAKILSLSYQAIERRLQKAKEKLGANTPAEIMAICFSKGLIKGRVV